MHASLTVADLTKVLARCAPETPITVIDQNGLRWNMIETNIQRADDEVVFDFEHIANDDSA
jgi:hypothetical protein